MVNELVSVVVPTFNRAYCVTRAVDSALAQTHAAVEVLVVDDGSSDGTRELIYTRYAAEPRVRYFYQPNQGVSVARNTGLLAARGEFVALLDSDDYWYPWKLAVQLAALRRFPAAGMVWTDMEAIDPQGKIVDWHYLRRMYDAYRQFTERDLFTEHAPLRKLGVDCSQFPADASVFFGDIFSQMIAGSLVHTSTVVMRRSRREAVGLFDPEIKGAGEDYDFHLRTCRAGPVAFVNLSSIQYQRGLTDHILRKENRLALAVNFLKVMQPYLERDRNRIRLSEPMLRGLLARTHSWIGEMALDVGEMSLARTHLAQSLRLNWKQPRFLGMWLLTWLPFRFEDRLRSMFRTVKATCGKPHPA